MTILLLRHGETDGNAARILQTADTPLNARGLRQAERLAERVHGLGAVHILCSDLLRARMTADPIARRLGLPVETTPLLQERNFGDLRGRSYAELGTNPFALDFVPPNGESWAAFHERVERAFAEVVARRAALQGNLVVVTHGLVCRAMVQRHAAPQPEFQAPDRFENTSVTILDALAPYALRLVNCYQHLDPADLELMGGAA